MRSASRGNGYPGVERGDKEETIRKPRVMV